MRSGVFVPLMNLGDRSRIAVEAYPGYFTKAKLGITSYKSDERAKQTAMKLKMRSKIVRTIRETNPLGIRIVAHPALLKNLVEEPTGDHLDAVICSMQAAWAWTRRDQNYGLPPSMDPLEGWIATVTL